MAGFGVRVKWVVALALMGSLMTAGAAGWAAEETKPEELKKVEAKAEEAKEPEKPQWSFSTDILSQYVWRGIALSRNSAVFQPSFTGSYKGFALNIWGNFDTSEANPFARKRINSYQPAWNETDFTFSYSKEIIQNLTLTGGLIYYLLSNNNSEFCSLEVYAGGDYKLPWFNFGVSVYREVSHFPGTFLMWYVHRAIDIPLMKGMNLDLFASWSAEFSNDKAAYPVYDSAGNVENKFYQSISAGYLAVALNIPLGKYVVVAPKIQYWYALGGQSTATLGGLSWDGKHNHILGGLNLTVNF
jgi:hypothetical protein